MKTLFRMVAWWRLTFLLAFLLLNFCAFLAREVAEGILTVRISRFSFTITDKPHER